jgi:iron complex transport system substrate-binding protein
MTRWAALLAALALAVAAACAHRHPLADPTDARRVVSLAPSTTEAIFAVGAGDRAVGRSTYCDYPPEATKLPAVGGVEPDLEVVLELRPDLVVGLRGASAARTAEKLSAHGIATWFPATDSLAEIDAMIVGMGARTGHTAEARRVAEKLEGQIAAVERAVASQPRPRVLMVVGVTPPVVAGPGSFADELLVRAGASNAAVEGGAWQTIGLERVAELDPDVVLDASESDGSTAPAITPGAPGWRGMRAVREGHVVRVSDGRVLRAGPRVGEGLAVLARLLHPDVRIP